MWALYSTRWEALNPNKPVTQQFSIPALFLTLHLGDMYNFLHIAEFVEEKFDLHGYFQHKHQKKNGIRQSETIKSSSGTEFHSNTTIYSLHTANHSLYQCPTIYRESLLSLVPKMKVRGLYFDPLAQLCKVPVVQ